MSHFRRAAVPFLLTIMGALVLPASGWSQSPFDCHVHRDHCLGEERDNITFYVDTDGSMNIDGGSSTSYWDAVTASIEEIAIDNHINGACGNCSSSNCDGVRLGIGYFGDESFNDAIDNCDVADSVPCNSYRAVNAGEDKRDNIIDSLNDEIAGINGLPGIETIGCPPSGTGQTDIFSCPSMGTLKSQRIICPPNGGVQTDEIGCPAMGSKKAQNITCPPNGRAQRSYVYASLFQANTFYSFDIDGETVSYTTNLFDSTTGDIAEGLYNDAISNSSITDRYNVTWTSPSAFVYFEEKTTGVPFTIVKNSPLSYFFFGNNWLPITGLPDQPSPDHDFKFKLNGIDVIHAGGSSETTLSVCNGLAAEVNALTASQNVEAVVIGSTLQVRSTVGGDDFTISSIDSSLTNAGIVTPFTPGLPGIVSAGYTFDFKVDNDNVKPAHDHIGDLETTTSVCDGLVAAVNAREASGDIDVSAVRVGDRVVLTSTVVGQNFNISQVDSYLTDYGTTVAGGAGLPGTTGDGSPGDGYDYTFQINGTDVPYVGGPTTSTNSLCDAIYTGIVASGEPVTATYVAGSGAIDIASNLVGLQYNITNFPGGLGLTTTSAGSAGLPGTPGPNYTYTFNYTDVDSNTVPINVPIGPTPTTASVCTALVTALTGTGDFAATTTGTTVTVTPTDPGASWTFSGIPSDFGYSTSISGLPANPGPYHAYDFDLDGTNVSYTDDGSPTQGEICLGLRNRINTTVGGTVNATVDALQTTVTITGLTPAVFNITNVDNKLGAHIVVRPAGLGPDAWSDLGQRIDNDLKINDRTQNAVVITHRAPEDYAGFQTGLAAICARRDNSGAPATTHFIGIGLSGSELDLLNVLAAAGGSGGCNVDPCVVPAVTATLTLAPGVICGGAQSATVGNVKWKILNIINRASCTFDLDVPPSYADGQAPNDANVIDVEIRSWNLQDLDGDPKVFRMWSGNWYFNNWAHYLKDNYDADHDSAHVYDDNGWEFAPGDRSKLTFSPGLCQAIRDGDITELRTEVGCQCPNQGEECTATTTLLCKDPLDPNSGTLVTCTAEQLANMRCATGVYICNNGVQVCSAGGINVMPEICNGIDDDCDGIIDNPSNSTEAMFQGRDAEGKNCNFKDQCMCPDNWKDTPSIGGIDEHLNSWSGTCTCGEGLEADAESNFSDGDPAEFGEPELTSDSDAACSVGMNRPSAGFLIIGLLGLLGFSRRRRR